VRKGTGGGRTGLWKGGGERNGRNRERASGTRGRKGQSQIVGGKRGSEGRVGKREGSGQKRGSGAGREREGRTRKGEGGGRRGK